jgi:DNA-binding CsgD family transcriptional regulator
METTRVLDALNGVTGLEARFTALRAVLAPPPEVALFYGFGAPRFAPDAGSGPRATRVIFDARLSDWWNAYCLDRGRRLKDPVRQAIRASLAPVSWSRIAQTTSLHDCRGPIWEPVHAHGITHAVSVPLHDPQARDYGSLAVISFDQGRESRAWMDELANELVAIAYVFHCGLDRSVGPLGSPDSRLSNRERECLELVASGLRSKQIAHILGLSSRTVDLHIARAMRRLGANSRMQAVFLAQKTDQLGSTALGVCPG